MSKFFDKWLGWIVLVGIAVSIFIVRHDASAQASNDRKTAAAQARNDRKTTALSQRAGCERTGVQKALSAAGWLRASEARRADGNIGAANYYEGIADGTILTIAAPEGMEGDRKLAAVELKKIAGRNRYVLTPASADLQRQGCERAYPLA